MLPLGGSDPIEDISLAPRFIIRYIPPKSEHTKSKRTSMATDAPG